MSWLRAAVLRWLRLDLVTVTTEEAAALRNILGRVHWNGSKLTAVEASAYAKLGVVPWADAEWRRRGWR